ncbi:hypothetical protein EV363DRAFT_559748 [Boletus edulis]|nr:hypothetical protein EV363DRAFT_559748 [Boletus edulis]
MARSTRPLSSLTRIRGRNSHRTYTHSTSQTTSSIRRSRSVSLYHLPLRTDRRSLGTSLSLSGKYNALAFIPSSNAISIKTGNGLRPISWPRRRLNPPPPGCRSGTTVNSPSASSSLGTSLSLSGKSLDTRSRRFAAATSPHFPPPLLDPAMTRSQYTCSSNSSQPATSSLWVLRNFLKLPRAPTVLMNCTSTPLPIAKAFSWEQLAGIPPRFEF